jgi:hypothetical protein
MTTDNITRNAAWVAEQDAATRALQRIESVRDALIFPPHLDRCDNCGDVSQTVRPFEVELWCWRCLSRELARREMLVKAVQL